jgi:hypothetical protein
VSIALSVEGSTDKAFLWPIVYRTALSLAVNAVVQETPFFFERGPNEERINRISEHVNEFDIFIVHADATRAALPRIKETIIDPIREGVVSRCRIEGCRLVGLITVSEMESWALASPRAVAESLGFEDWPDRLPLHWNPAEAETLGDPKRVLQGAFEGLLQRPLNQVLLHETLDALASRVLLDELDGLPSYRQFRDDLKMCLTALRAG